MKEIFALGDLDQLDTDPKKIAYFQSLVLNGSGWVCKQYVRMTFERNEDFKKLVAATLIYPKKTYQFYSFRTFLIVYVEFGV